jgi:hypothetical protein
MTTMTTSTIHPGSAAMFSTSGAAMAAAVGQVAKSGCFDDLIFLLMSEVNQVYSDKLSSQVEQFQSNTRLQAKYARFRKIMSALQASEATAPRGSKNGLVNVQQLKDAGLSTEEIAKFEKHGYQKDGRVAGWTANGVAAGLNEALFGAENTHLHVDVAFTNTVDDWGVEREGGFPVKGEIAEQMQTMVYDKVEQAQSANVSDTTLLSMDISRTMQEMQKITSTLSKVLQTRHQTAMDIIRNM